MSPSRTPSLSAGTNDVDDVTSAVLTASRALLGIAVRSIALVEDEVDARAVPSVGAAGVSGPAECLGPGRGSGVHPSTATRLCDRLVAEGSRRASDLDRESARNRSLGHADGTSDRSRVSARRRKEVTGSSSGFRGTNDDGCGTCSACSQRQPVRWSFPTTLGNSAGRRDGGADTRAVSVSSSASLRPIRGARFSASVVSRTVDACGCGASARWPSRSAPPQCETPRRKRGHTESSLPTGRGQADHL